MNPVRKVHFSYSYMAAMREVWSAKRNAEGRRGLAKKNGRRVRVGTGSRSAKGVGADLFAVFIGGGGSTTSGERRGLHRKEGSQEKRARKREASALTATERKRRHG